MKKYSQKIRKLFLEDQKDRRKKGWLKLEDKKRWALISLRDKKRRKELEAILKKKPEINGTDYFNAGIIFQHGTSRTSIKEAREMALMGMEKGHKKSAWLYAAATDRLLVMKNKPQKFGTQFRKNKNGGWELFPILSRTTDAERKKYGIRTLQNLKKVVLNLNRSGTALRKKISVSSQ
ncbi:MAG TPA: hypothetical protein VEK36_01395 [Candidatus Paceibacterota bacterium]|nr:hypothetical protein [Candidatus Paceibacterota bacterium]